MNELHDEPPKVFVGTGEFQLRKVHVVAKVEICDGRVRKVEFSSDDGNTLEGTEEVAKLLVDQPLSKALEVKVEQVVSNNDRDEETTSSALLEAFHRAIESYIDEE